MDKQCYSVNSPQIEFSKKIKEIDEWYQLFSSFEDHEIPADRREIILQNLLYQFINAEKKYEAYATGKI